MLAEYLWLIRASVMDPRAAAARLFSYPIEGRALWTALGAMACIATAMIYATLALTPTATQEQQLVIGVLRPIPLALTFIVAWGILAACTYYIGRGFGGTGSFDNALKAVLWLQILQTSFLVLQPILVLALSALSVFISLAAIILITRCFVICVTVLHGFAQPWMVFAGMLVSSIAVLFVLSLAFGILVAVLGLEVQNV